MIKNDKEYIKNKTILAAVDGKAWQKVQQYLHSDPSPSPASEQDGYGMQDTNREGCEHTQNIKTTD